MMRSTRDADRKQRRTTHYPAWYRVSFETVKGRTWCDFRTLEEARRFAGNHPCRILACWEVAGERTIDSEPVQ